jgi:uroporphyrinogen decarboxylase
MSIQSKVIHPGLDRSRADGLLQTASGAPLRSERFLRACRREPVDVTPIWMMRQAGRSLPAYRELRKRYGLVDITRQPELCAEVTLMPLRLLEVDAAILFADIMLPLAGLGVAFELVEDVGPVVAEPVRRPEQVQQMTSVPPDESVPTVLEAIRILRRELEGVVPLIGFSGAPFTLASYLVEGRPTRTFAKTKALMFGDPITWHALMDRLADLVIDYLEAQVAAGVQALQLFDSWVGALSPSDMRRYVTPHTRRIFEATASLGVPRIHFGTNTATLLELMAAPGPEVVGVDWRIPLDAAWRRIGSRAIQGNLDPAALLGPPEVVTEAALDVLKRAGGRPGHIFNLGHGVLPATPLGNLQLLVETVHSHEPGS